VSDLDEVLNEIEWRRCFPQTDDVEKLLEGFVHFCGAYWYIRHPSRGKILFKLRPAQVIAARDWLEYRYNIDLKARQLGWSTLGAAFALWETWGYADRFEIFLSKGERESVKLLGKTKYGFKYLPNWMRRRGPKVLGDQAKLGSQQKMEFDNDSAIESLPSKNDPARGESVYRVWVDEWAFLENPDEAWASIEPITDVGGRVVGLSTANGAGTFFEELWVGAETGDNNFHGRFFGWWEDGERDQDWYAKKKKAYKGREHLFYQEYPSTPEEAFLRSGNAVFDLDKLRELAEAGVEDPRTFTLAFISTEDWSWRELGGGELKVWEEPQPNELYVIGADIAEGKSEHADYSVAQVLKLRPDEPAVQVACWHGHIDLDLFGEQVLFALGSWYNECLAVPENNSVGVATIQALKRVYARIYRTRRITTKTTDPIDQYGFRTTQSTKPYLISELNGALRDDELVIHDANTFAELKSFVRDGRKMQGSPHDDRTMALALANEGRKHAWKDEYRPPKKSDKGSEAYYLRLIKAQHGGSKRPKVIGRDAVSRRSPLRRGTKRR
jgi:hypothetical protein